MPVRKVQRGQERVFRSEPPRERLHRLMESLSAEELALKAAQMGNMDDVMRLALPAKPPPIPVEPPGAEPETQPKNDRE